MDSSGLWLLSQPTRFKNVTTSAMWISVKLATNVAMTENVSKRPRRPKKSATMNAETLVKPAMKGAKKHLSMKRKSAEMTVNVCNAQEKNHECHDGCIKEQIKHCKQRCDNHFEHEKERCGDDAECLQQAQRHHQKCHKECNHMGPPPNEEATTFKISCSDGCDRKAKAAAKKCDGDEACMKKVKKMWGKCSGACKCQTGCDKKPQPPKKNVMAMR